MAITNSPYLHTPSRLVVFVHHGRWLGRLLLRLKCRVRYFICSSQQPEGKGHGTVGHSPFPNSDGAGRIDGLIASSEGFLVNTMARRKNHCISQVWKATGKSVDGRQLQLGQQLDGRWGLLGRFIARRTLTEAATR